MSAADTGLYKDAYERDSCGFGLIANLDDQPSHWLVQTAIYFSQPFDPSWCNCR
jgi:glutamate synthase (NADPH/NADH) large chain